MMYRAKCTYCITLLKNCNKYKDCYYCHDKYDSYIEVNNPEEANLIEQLNGHQEGTFKVYKELLKEE